jgi:hypothetical protein
MKENRACKRPQTQVCPAEQIFFGETSWLWNYRIFFIANAHVIYTKSLNSRYLYRKSKFVKNEHARYTFERYER